MPQRRSPDSQEGASVGSDRGARRARSSSSTRQETSRELSSIFADSSSWDAEVAHLTRAGYPVISFADPLRSVTYDSEALKDLLDTISGPVVLVGHSYAGMVVSQVAAEDSEVKALVYVAAFIPQVGESVNSLNSMFPGSELVAANLRTTFAPDGLTDVYIDQDKYGQVYAGGLSPAQIRVAAGPSVRSRPRR